MTRLGAGRAADGHLAPERVAATAAALGEQVRHAQDNGARRIEIVATAAVRGAPDAARLAEYFSAAAGLPVEVLDGDTEARLAFRGATCAITPRPRGEVAILDVGGASTEIVVGRCGLGPSWAVSLAIGSGRLAELAEERDPPSSADLDRMRATARAALAEVAPPAAEAVWAVGGSATSVARLLGGGDLSRPALGRALEALCAAPAEELASRHGLHPDRMRMLPAGLVILDAAAELLDASLQMASGGLREGVILAMLDGER